MMVYCDINLIADNVSLADNFGKRLIGLMGKKNLNEGEGLLLWNCSAIHCFFMKIPIDVIYISRDLSIVGVATLKPWSIGSHFKEAAHVLELKEGASSKVKAGDKIVFIK